jgi:hypothetical protein
MYREPPPYFYTVILSPLDDMSHDLNDVSRIYCPFPARQ